MMRLPRGMVRDIILIVAASVFLVVLFATLRRLGLPFGLRVVPMGEDYNWLLILRAPSAAAQAQAFWAIDGRNPLSPWWYIAAQRLYVGFPNGPFLTRLAINPLLATGAYAAVRAMAPTENRAVALACGLIVALWSFAVSIDQIHWNFLGALSLSLWSVAVFGVWIHTERRSGGLYGLALCLWFGAFATYAFQVGAILAMGLLSLTANLRSRMGIVRTIGRTTAEIMPFALLFGLFLLVWDSTQNPLTRAAFELRADLLLTNLPASIFQGLWPARYSIYAHLAMIALGLWLLPITVLVGITVALIVRSALPPRESRLTQSFGILALGWCIVIPTALIESMSVIWTVGTRWRMVDQVWQPLLWLGLAWLVAGLLPRLRNTFPVVGGIVAGLILILSLGHNSAATALSTHERALRQGVTTLAARWDRRSSLHHVIVLVDPDVSLYAADELSQRIASVWLPDYRMTLRVLQSGATPVEPSHMTWWNVVLDDDSAHNVAIGGEVSSYTDLVFTRFDGQNLTVLNRLTEADVRSYPVEWRRSRPLDMPAHSCPIR